MDRNGKYCSRTHIFGARTVSQGICYFKCYKTTCIDKNMVEYMRDIFHYCLFDHAEVVHVHFP